MATDTPKCLLPPEKLDFLDSVMEELSVKYPDDSREDYLRAIYWFLHKRTEHVQYPRWPRY